MSSIIIMTLCIAAGSALQVYRVVALLAWAAQRSEQNGAATLRTSLQPQAVTPNSDGAYPSIGSGTHRRLNCTPAAPAGDACMAADGRDGALRERLL